MSQFGAGDQRDRHGTATIAQRGHAEAILGRPLRVEREFFNEAPAHGRQRRLVLQLENNLGFEEGEPGASD